MFLRRVAKASKLGPEGTCTTFEKESTRTTFEKCGINVTLFNVDKGLSLSLSIFEKSDINVTLLNVDKDLCLESHAIMMLGQYNGLVNHALT